MKTVKKTLSNLVINVFGGELTMFVQAERIQTQLGHFQVAAEKLELFTSVFSIMKILTLFTSKRPSLGAVQTCWQHYKEQSNFSLIVGRRHY